MKKINLHLPKPLYSILTRSHFFQEKGGIGFTLIELLVVTAIIGILASVIVVSLGSARENARDSRRLGDIKQISLALEIYIGRFNHYPPVTPGGSSESRWQEMASCLMGNTSGCEDEANSGQLKLIPATPQDPLQGQFYDYLPSNDLKGFVVKTVLENTTHDALDSDTDSDITDSYGTIICNDGSLGSPTGNYCIQIF